MFSTRHRATLALGLAFAALLAACATAPAPTRETAAAQPPASPQTTTAPADSPEAVTDAAPPPAPSPMPTQAAEIEPPPPPAPKTKAKPTPAPVVTAAKKPKPPAAAPGGRSPPPPKTVASAAARTVAGRFELVAGAGQRIAPGEVSEGVIYFLPKAGSPKPRPGSFSMKTLSKGFSPNVLVVPIGSTVRFPNTDTILHNVYSRSPGREFELGLYPPGESRQTVMRKAGLVTVSCNVHHGMRANIVVLETPYSARPGARGQFEIKNVPSGPGTLVFWHPRATAQTVAVTLPLSGPVVRKLVASRPRIDASMAGH